MNLSLSQDFLLSRTNTASLLMLLFQPSECVCHKAEEYSVVQGSLQLWCHIDQDAVSAG